MDFDFYRARLEQYQIVGNISITLQNFLEFTIGLGAQYTDVDEERGSDNILNEPQLGINPNVFSSQYYAILTSGISLKDVDNAMNPHYGFKFSFNTTGNLGLNLYSSEHIQLTSTSTFYVSSSSKRQFTFAGRVGGDHLIGSFPFYQANTLGASKNLRGYSNQRFSGRSTIFANAEVRLELVNFYRYLFGGKGGILSFYDVGRVWTDGENSKILYNGYGGGVWFNIFDEVLISAYYGTSGSENSFEV